MSLSQSAAFVSRHLVFLITNKAPDILEDPLGQTMQKPY